jgi:hypothetical protein
VTPGGGDPGAGRVGRRAVLAGVGAALAAAACAPVTAVLAAGGDAGLLSVLATLEDAAVYVYTSVGPRLSRAPLPAYAQSFLTHHTAHRDALLAALHSVGAAAPPTGRPHPDLLPSGSDEAALVASLLAVEGQLLSAQHGALASLGTRARRVQVASIFGVDARHAAVWRDASGLSPAPASFVTGP